MGPPPWLQLQALLAALHAAHRALLAGDRSRFVTHLTQPIAIPAYLLTSSAAIRFQRHRGTSRALKGRRVGSHQWLFLPCPQYILGLCRWAKAQGRLALPKTLPYLCGPGPVKGPVLGHETRKQILVFLHCH